MQESLLSFSKVFLVFLLLFGFATLAALFFEPKQGDNYSVVFLVSKKTPSTISLDSVQKAILRFDRNHNCYTKLPEFSFAFGIKNGNGTDKNYEVSYFATNNVNLQKNFVPLGTETMLVKDNETLETEKKFLFSDKCISLPFYLVVKAKDKQKDFNVYFLVSNPEIKQQKYSLLFLDLNTAQKELLLDKDQNNNLVFDENKNCFLNFPDLRVPFTITNFEGADATYSLRYFVASAKDKPLAESLVATEKIFLQKNDSIFVDKNLSISEKCLAPQFFVIVEAKALKTTLLVTLDINSTSTINGDSD